jgi:uncharacterized protein
LEFEWDERKARQNAAKHGVPFGYATRVFLDPHRLDAEDSRCDYGEERRITLGRIEERLFVVVYALRGKIVRLISARKANDRERERYDETLSA